VVNLQRETYKGVIEELKPLLMKHWEEIAHYKDIPLDPAYEVYQSIEDKGALRMFTARDDGGRIVGYSVFFRGSLHYKGFNTFSQDVLFVLPEYRGRLGYRLIRFCDEQLKAEGAQVVYHHVKLQHDFGPLLKRMGYEPIDVIYGRRL